MRDTPNETPRLMQPSRTMHEALFATDVLHEPRNLTTKFDLVTTRNLNSEGM